MEHDGMKFLQNIKLIQGGMGVYVSNWRLAKAVAVEKTGVTAGTVSGTALDVVYVRLLQLGDPGGHVRRALAAFDTRFGVNIGQKICDRYFVDGGKAPLDRYKSSPKHLVQGPNKNDTIPPVSQTAGSIELNTSEEVIELLVATGFAEVWLAKQGHNGLIFINFLNKVELPLVYAMYGAMLAGVDGIIVGAGNPDGLPAICSRLAKQQAVSHDLPVLYRASGEMFSLPFDPNQLAGGKLAQKTIHRPAFLAIVSLENLVQSLAQSQSEAPDGFIIEHHTAGGHNAGPQGPIRLDDKGQPIYSELDEPDLQVIRQVGLPFWLAGGYGSRDKLQQALAAGAAGVQVGSLFALAEESGMKPAYRTAILDRLKINADDDGLVLTTLFSPTGYPFKVVHIDGTLADNSVYTARSRVCDLGFLQQRGLSQPDQDGNRRLFQRCQAGPIEDFLRKRGLEHNTRDRRCLCNGLLSSVGLGQIIRRDGILVEEPAIVTLGNHLDGIRRLSRNGQTHYWVHDVVNDILGQDELILENQISFK